MKTTAIFAVLVAALVAFTTYDYVSGQKREAAKTDSVKLVKIARSELSFIDVSSKFTLGKKDNHWSLLNPIQESADQQAVFSFLDSLYGQSASQTVKEGSDIDFTQYGLAKPQFDLTLKSPAATEILHIGTVKAYDGSLYGRLNDDQKVLLISSAWDVIVTKPVDELRDKKLYRGDVKSEFDDMIVKGNDAFQIRKNGEIYHFVSPKTPFEPLAANVKAWLEQVKALRGIQFLEPRTKFKPDTVLTLKRTGQPDFSIELMHDKDHPAQSFVTSSDVPGHHAMIIGKSALERVLLSLDVFYDKRLPFTFKPDEVTRVVFHDALTGKDTIEKVDSKDPYLTKLAQLEAVRFLGPASQGIKGEQKSSLSHLSLLKSDESVVFEMWWGKPVIEKAFNDRPEARYLPVITNLSKLVVGVPEKEIAGLAEGSPSASAKKEK